MVRLGDVDATKTTTHLRGDGRKVPGIRGVLRQNGLGAIIARRGDERVYERHDTLRRAQKKNEDQEKGTPLPLFPKQRPKEELYTNRENNTRWESETNLKSTRVKQKEKERRRRRKRRICAWTDTKKENTTRGRRVTTVY